jgi:hypothetical protein
LVWFFSLIPLDKKISFKFQRRYFQLGVSFAMTINKSREWSLKHLKRVGVYISHDELYFSWPTMCCNVQGKNWKILIIDGEGEDTNEIGNVVYKKVF